jgi:DNA polymerase III sliding clamp (beta) subunit (PCNA family)
VKINSTAFRKALQRIQAGCGRRISLYNGEGKAMITASPGTSVTISTRTPSLQTQTTCLANVEEDESYLVDFRRLLAWLKLADKDVTCTLKPGTKADSLLITSKQNGKKRRVTLAGSPPEFVSRHAPLTEKPIQMSSTFVTELGRVAIAANLSDERIALNGILIAIKNKVMSVVAADGFRLGIQTAQVDLPDMSALVPRNTVITVGRMATRGQGIQIQTSENQVAFTLTEEDTPDVVVISQLYLTNYVAYQRILVDQSTATATVKRSELQQVLKSAAMFTDWRGGWSQVRFVLSEKRLTFHAASDLHVFSGWVPVISRKGEAEEPYYNARLFLEVLRRLEEVENVTLHLGAARSPASLTSTEVPGWRYVVFPMMPRIPEPKKEEEETNADTEQVSS